MTSIDPRRLLPPGLHRRRLRGLPAHGYVVQVLVRVRCFRCLAVACPQQTFTAPLPSSIASVGGSCTTRLDDLLGDLGRSLGGRPAAALARRLMLPVGKDTLLRIVRRQNQPDTEPLHAIGIDEGTWRRRHRHRYDMLICDLERGHVVELLPDREPATVKARLSQRPEINVVARDRAGGYAGAVTAAAPQAMQVAERWHLMENASTAFLNAVQGALGVIRRVLGAGAINPDLLSAAERLQYGQGKLDLLRARLVPAP